MKVVGLVGVPDPATVRAVVPSVSVNTPLLLTEIMFPFLSVVEAAPAPTTTGGLMIFPIVVVIVETGPTWPVAFKMNPEPSVASEFVIP